MRLLVTFCCSVLIGLSSAFSQKVYSCKQDLFPSRHPEKKLFGYVDLFGNWKVRPYYDFANYFSEGLAVVKKRSKFGVINCEGKVLLRVEYDEIKDFVNGFSWVRKGELWGLVDFNGKTILEPKYDKVEDISKFSDFAWLRTESKWGVFDKEKVKFIHAPQFDSYQLLNDKTSLVEVSGKKGMIKHAHVNFILQPEFESINKFAPYLLEITKDSKVGVVSDYGRKLLSSKYDNVYDLGVGRFSVELKGKQALLTNRGQKLTGFIADSISPFSEGKSILKNKEGYYYLSLKGKRLYKKVFQYSGPFKNGKGIVKLNDRYQIIKKDGSLFSRSFDSLSSYGNFYVGRDKQKEYIIRDPSGGNMNDFIGYEKVYNDIPQHTRVKMKTQDSFVMFVMNLKNNNTSKYYEDISEWNDWGYALVKQGGKVGFLKNDLTEVVSLDFESANVLDYDGSVYFNVKRANAAGFTLLNESGKEIVNTEFDKISYAGKNKFIIRDSKTQYSKVINTKGQTVLEMDIFDLEYNEGSKSYVGLNSKGKRLLISSSGEVLSKKYAGVTYLGFDRYSAWKKSKETVLNGKGEVVIAKSLLNFSSFQNKGLFVVMLNEKYALANKKGDLVTKYSYDEIWPFYGGYAVAKRNGFYGILNRKGKEIRSFVHSGFVIEEKYFLLVSDNHVVKLFLTGELK